MKLNEKVKILQDDHMGKWLKARQQVWDALSVKYPMFCICGKLCTGLHENTCSRFQKKITSETVKQLNHLIAA